MSIKEKATAPVSSVGADGKQPLSKSNKKSIADLPPKGNLQATERLRKFTFGFNWIEFTHDALIMYQAMTCGFTLTQILYFCKA